MREEQPYDTAQIKVFEGAEAVRRRPGMYLGSTSARGLHTMLLSVVEHLMNEAAAEGDRAVRVTLTADGGVRVEDDGPGIPFGSPPESGGAVGGGSGLEERLTRFVLPEKPLGRSRVQTWGGDGMILVIANALSVCLTAEVRRAGLRRVQKFARGVALAPPSSAGPAERTGTTLAFRPDPAVFEAVVPSFAVLDGRLAELAFLYPGLDVTLTDERPGGGPAVRRYRSPDGVRGLVASLVPARAAFPAEYVLSFTREGPAGVLDVALAWAGEGPGQVLGFANGMPTGHGGTHLEGFRDGLTAAVTAYTSAYGPMSPQDPGAGADLLERGLVAVVSVKLDAPAFEGATRTRLAGDDVRAFTAEAVREELLAWLEAGPGRAGRLLGRVTGAAPS
ncbi:DNA gyrase subunit B [Streptomyces termitum]|uniref:DNA gyrase subunit B n=1 Tax=Streptomyces termitum TaxID=67368 RepID=UPI0033B4AEC9